LIVLTLVIAIPGAALMVGFNVLFAETVPPEWRGYVAGVRNALFAVVFVITSLLSGVILRRLPFPVGYQVIFGLGCLGAGMSAVHLAFIHLPKEEPRANRDAKPAPSAMPPSTESPIGGAPRSQVGLRFLRNRIPNLRADVLRGSFGGVVASIGVFHLAFFLAIPLFPLFLVDRLHFNDQQISLGTAVYYLTFFMGSLLLDQATRRLGNHRLFTLGAVLGSLYPVLIAITPGLGLYLITSAIGGIAGALFAGALANYVLERAPADQRPAAMAWYNLAINAGVLLGSLAGPVVAEVTGLVAALIAFAAIRWLAAFALLRWGK
jgi:MFS family permease